MPPGLVLFAALAGVDPPRRVLRTPGWGPVEGERSVRADPYGVGGGHGGVVFEHAETQRAGVRIGGERATFENQPCLYRAAVHAGYRPSDQP
jgi:hypothetical protein